MFVPLLHFLVPTVVLAVCIFLRMSQGVHVYIYICLHLLVLLVCMHGSATENISPKLLMWRFWLDKFMCC